jgi:hypothetical protein
MDGTRFDEMTRALGQGRSRRSVLKALGAAAVGVASLSKLGRVEAAGPGNSACAKFCHDVFGPGSKAAGQCTSQAAKGTGPCITCGGTAARYCNGTCVDLDTDADNCGACGITCDDGNACTTDSCSAGQCVHTPVVVDDGDSCTVDTCDPVTGEVTHAPVDCSSAATGPCTTGICNGSTGACEVQAANEGSACTAEGGLAGTCAAGSCVPTDLCADVTCTAPDACHTAGTCDPAAGTCSEPVATVDFQSDLFNCGSCGHVCFVETSGSICVDGACVCPPETQECSSSGCMPLCSADPGFFAERFQSCFNDKAFCEGRSGQTCCEFCTTWTGCYGGLNTGTICGAVTAGC